MNIKKIAAIAICAAIMTTATVAVSADNSATVSEVELVESAGVVYTGVSEVAENCMPAIVSITNQSVQLVNEYYALFGNRFGNGDRSYTSTSVGSGIVVGQNDTELLIASNNHVVENADTLTVTFVDGESYEAQLKGYDDENDLAVIAIPLSEMSADTLSQIRIAKIGNSDEVKVGEQVVAIGNALGYGQSVTTGIVSAIGRNINVSDSYYGSSYTVYEDLIQTDAAINGGNSGGALLNLKGELIGINSAKATRSGVEGMGYAINVNKAMDIISELMERETRVKVPEAESGYLGITGGTINSQYYRLPAGVYISTVAEGGAAERAGLTADDIITSVGGYKVTTIDELKEALLYFKAGETVEVVAYVDDENYGYTEQTFEVTLDERPHDEDSDAETEEPAEGEDDNQQTDPREEFYNYFFGGDFYGRNGGNGSEGTTRAW